MYSVGKRACVEPLKNKIEILKEDVAIVEEGKPYRA